MINKKRLISTFLDLVKIDSPSGDEQKISDFVCVRLKKLGLSLKFDSIGNIIARLDGEGAPFLLNSHLDTVEPGRGVKPEVLKDKIVSDGTTILGADAKAGVAAILEVVESIIESKTKHLPLEILFTLQEETGLYGAINLDYSKIKSKIGITLDGTRGPEHIITSAPGYTRVDAIITGRGAHAGFEPEKGISAIKIAAEIISKLEIGKIDDNTTANIGLISGGTARNAIAETVHIQGEIRSRDLKKLEKHTGNFEKIFTETVANHNDAKLTLNLKTEFNPYIFEESHAVIQKTVKALKSLGLAPQLAPSGGGADVNIFHTHGIEAICIGAGYHNPHTTREYADIEELLNAAKVCEKLVSI